MTTDIKRNEQGVAVRRLGKTELEVSVMGFGGGHYCRPPNTEADCVSLIRRSIDAGITFMDNAWGYWDGESERRMGKALTEGYRDKVVLMTKVCSRDYDSAMSQLHESLARLRTDVIDVWQCHEVNYDNDPDWIFRDDGAARALEDAKQQGKVRFVGFTGHKSPHILKRMFDFGFDWDTVQMPINVMDYHYRSFTHDIMPIALERDMGIIGMKSLGGDGQIVNGAGLTPEECRHYSMSLPISTLVAGIQTEEDIQQDIAIAQGFEPYSDELLTALRERVLPFATDGRFEVFKTSQKYDAKYHRDQRGYIEPAV